MTRIARALTGGVMLVALAAGGAGAAKPLRSATPEKLGKMLSNEAVTYRLVEKEDGGAPDLLGTLTTEAGKVSFLVRPKTCSGAPSACETFVFFANWHLGRDAEARDFRIANDFNGSRAFGRAYVLESTNQIGVDFTVELKGGVTEDFVKRAQARWAAVIDSFLTHYRGAVAEAR